jgi:hypothetical protein
MRQDIERIFVTKQNLTDEDRARAAFDKYIKGEISNHELTSLLEIIGPKPLKHKSELPGYT